MILPVACGFVEVLGGIGHAQWYGPEVKIANDSLTEPSGCHRLQHEEASERTYGI